MLATQKIHLLDNHVINQIKAGEVVERPYNVVKELVENAIDADANEIFVEILDGGKQLIRITDNGHGISKTDLPLALQRHATSKIQDAHDLNSLASFGFRGEALPSIAAVSCFSIRSRQAQDSFGNEIHVENGVLSEPKDVVMPTGTTVTVRQLFCNTPARLKFLKSTSTEFTHIQEFLTAVCLCYPSISFRFSHNSRDVFFYASRNTQAERFQDMLGLETKQYAPVTFSRGSFHISGFALLPAYARPTSIHLVTFVNGRFVKDRIVRTAVQQAYEGLLLKGLSPSAFVFIQVDPAVVDVNAHPCKTEIRFYDPFAIQEWVIMGIQQSLKSQITSTLQSSQTHTQIPVETRPAMSFATEKRFSHVAQLKTSPETFFTPAKVNPQINVPVQIAPQINAPNGLFSMATYLGQFANCFLIFQIDSDLCFVDQHAFHERILFEEILLAHKSNKMAKQSFLTPLLVQLDTERYTRASDYQEKIASIGFDIELLKEQKIAIHCHPAFLKADRIEHIFTEMLGQFSLNENAFHLVFATMACHSAVRAGEPFDQELAQRLLRRAADVDFYAHCPHGRPVIRKFSKKDVESWFQRI